MKRKILIRFFLATLVMGFFQTTSHAQVPVTLMTFNIRLDLESDSQNSWSHRKDLVVSHIRLIEPDLIGVQEALPHQMRYLEKELTGFQSVGVGRDDGKEKGEYSAIFFRKSRFALLKSSTFWLSEKPEVPGEKGWDAACNRIVTWVKIRDMKTGSILFHFNTHFDHVGQVARRESAGLILKAIDSLSGNSPALLTRDFNAFPSDEPIRILTNPENPHHLTDSRKISENPMDGTGGTFNGFGLTKPSDDPIDYFFVKPGIKVLNHGIQTQKWNGRFSSDHFPVWARVLLAKGGG